MAANTKLKAKGRHLQAKTTTPRRAEAAPRKSRSAALTQNFHVPLPEALHAEIRAAAQEAGCPSTELAREFLRAGLERRRAERTARELSEYVAAMAGTTDDLDPELEAAGLENLVRLPQ